MFCSLCIKKILYYGLRGKNGEVGGEIISSRMDYFECSYIDIISIGGINWLFIIYEMFGGFYLVVRVGLMR